MELDFLAGFDTPLADKILPPRINIAEVKTVNFSGQGQGQGTSGVKKVGNASNRNNTSAAANTSKVKPGAGPVAVKSVNRSKPVAASAIATAASAAYYKKQGVKIAGGVEGRRQLVRQEAQVRRKSLRQDQLLKRRNLPGVGSRLKSVEEDSQSTLSLSPTMERSVRTNNSGSTSAKDSTTDSSSSPSLVSDPRRAQLQKWKNEKQLLQKKIDPTVKPVFKPGGASKGQGPAIPTNVKGKMAVTSGRPVHEPPPTKPLRPNNTGTLGLPAPERRVTRAMAKEMTVPQRSSNPKTKEATVSTMMKDLAINPTGRVTKNQKITATSTVKNDKPVPKNVPAALVTRGAAAVTVTPGQKKPQQPAGAAGTSNGRARFNNSNAKVVTSGKTGNTNVKAASPTTAESSCSSDEVQGGAGDMDVDRVPAVEAKPKETPAPARPKKLKPKAIDSVYTEYNGVFSEACKKLTTYLAYWRNVIDTSTDVPDAIKGDLDSAVGKGKLLLDSKLPQFGQLLYSYLCKEMDPGLILECDLQGWWAVAEIQIAKVYEEYERLKVIKERNWIPIEENVAVDANINAVTARTPLKPIKAISRTQPSKATTSRGLKEFLAMKRANANKQASTSDSDTTSDRPQQMDTVVAPNAFAANVDSSDSASVSETASGDHECNQFEGGFFVISSPSRTPCNRRSSLRRKIGNVSLTPRKVAITTPNRRMSTSGSVVLKLRQSMGRLYSMGARTENGGEF